MSLVLLLTIAFLAIKNVAAAEPPFEVTGATIACTQEAIRSGCTTCRAIIELFGNGRSSSPSNTPEPFHGPRFPVTTIRDNVEAVHALLTTGLGIHHLKAVIGFSMGAQQAFQWAVSYPRLHGQNCRHIRHGEDLRPRDRAAGK